MNKFQIKNLRNNLEKDLSKSNLRKLVSPIIYSQYETTVPLTQKHIRGNLIDIGCGYSPYKNLLINYVLSYEGIDRHAYNEDVTFVGDFLEDFPSLENMYDCAISFEVLEHISNTDLFLQQVHKILKPHGKIIISVPHLSRLHEEPYDFFRFTKYGLEEIFSRNDFVILQIEKKGSIFSFLGHQFSTIFVSIFWLFPVIRYFALFINFVFITLPCFWIDKIIDRNGLFAQGYVVVAKKNEKLF
jgi:SAM-dependent methyltransferase